MPAHLGSRNHSSIPDPPNPGGGAQPPRSSIWSRHSPALLARLAHLAHLAHLPRFPPGLQQTFSRLESELFFSPNSCKSPCLSFSPFLFTRCHQAGFDVEFCCWTFMGEEAFSRSRKAGTLSPVRPCSQPSHPRRFPSCWGARGDHGAAASRAHVRTARHNQGASTLLLWAARGHGSCAPKSRHSEEPGLALCC